MCCHGEQRGAGIKALTAFLALPRLVSLPVLSPFSVRRSKYHWPTLVSCVARSCSLPLFAVYFRGPRETTHGPPQPPGHPPGHPRGSGDGPNEPISLSKPKMTPPPVLRGGTRRTCVHFAVPGALRPAYGRGPTSQALKWAHMGPHMRL
jgi:hypothetical protein